ncbi:MAG: hypothetical protein H6799_02860 [Candidatus Nomurabacteria bacterium]|nr:MAG: hypothetical protein H6799_02860 [Candidatus Nomurabacteria bacterium]
MGTARQSTIDTKFEDVGFIHATNPDQTIAIPNRHFNDRDDVIFMGH